MVSLNFNPRVIAHRGASAYAPENTVVAFTKAAQLGIKWVEFDVMLTADNVPIIFHDDELDRTTNGRGEVSVHSAAYLATLDAGSWFNPIYSGEKIPTLKAVLDVLSNTQLSANVEIKAPAGQDEKLVIRILETMSGYLQQRPSTILFSSFSVDALRYLRHYFPQARCGLLLHEWEPNWQALCEELQCVSVHVNHEIMTVAAAKQIKAMNNQLLCYTVNDDHRAQALYAMGVDAVFSDAPDRIMA